jgi:uncharacterized protein DUF6226
MSNHAFTPEGPSPESYSRVTNAARFQDLHRIALERLDQLERQFDVRRTEPYEASPDLANVPFARPAVNLAPANSSAAPIAVAFTSFPGLLVQSGRWTVHALPACGCDACAETLEGESQKFLELIDDVVAGRFRESISIPWIRSSAQRWETWSTNRRQGGGRLLTRKRARELVESGARSYEWSPWLRQ